LENDLHDKIENRKASEGDQALTLSKYVMHTKIDKLLDLVIFESPNHEIRNSDFI
jgi:hypothetical protein